MRFRPLSVGLKLSLVASLGIAFILLSWLSWAGWGVFLPGSSYLVATVNRPFYFGILAVSLTGAVSAILVALTHWFVDRPLSRLMKVMEEAPAKDFLVRAPVEGDDVIGRLSRSFNHLLERMTTIDAFKIETEQRLSLAQRELKFKAALEEKSRIIEKTNKDLEARVKELSLLHEFSQHVSSTLDLRELCGLTEIFLANNLGFQEFAILIFDEPTSRLVVKVAHGFSDQQSVLGMTFGEGEGISGRVLVSGEMIYIPDTTRSGEYLHYKGQKREDGSFLALPLVFKKKVVGVLNMFRQSIDAFPMEEIRFLQTMAVELTIAVVNAKRVI
jgi:nitrate/nitrite-specific signal transduction histidine kinase